MKNRPVFFLVLLMMISFVVRAILAAWLELGNDEVYYVTYALYPEWSYFDHPPMVGWLIRLFSLNLLMETEWAARLPSLILGTLNIGLIYHIVVRLKNKEAGLYAALLYTGSVYASVISGLFILPDTPQGTFWLLALYAFLQSAVNRNPGRKEKNQMLYAGVFTGLALLSKYTSVFLWVGAGLYILFFNRQWLKTKELYLAGLISMLLFTPVLIWNIQHDWMSFSFHGERVDFRQAGLRPDLLGTEVGGQLFYNNPFNVILGFIAVTGFFKGRRYLSTERGRFLILVSLPLIGIFILASLFRQTLPHWSGPGYYGLIILAATWLTWKHESEAGKGLPPVVKASLLFICILLIAGVLQIQYGIFLKPDPSRGVFRGKNDFSLDMYGWKQAGEKFARIQKREESSGNISEGAPLLSFRWFPAAHLDYYLARPNQSYVLACGTLNRIHHFKWINQYRGGFEKHREAWYVVPGRDYKNPEALCPERFPLVEPCDTIPILRNQDTVMFFLVYKLSAGTDSEKH